MVEWKTLTAAPEVIAHLKPMLASPKEVGRWSLITLCAAWGKWHLARDQGGREPQEYRASR